MAVASLPGGPTTPSIALRSCGGVSFVMTSMHSAHCARIAMASGKPSPRSMSGFSSRGITWRTSAASPMRAASERQEICSPSHGARASSLAPRSSSSCATGRAPGMPQATSRGVRAVGRPRVDVRAGVEQRARNLEVGDAPHQRGGAGIVGGVGIGAGGEQPPHRSRLTARGAATISGVDPAVRRRRRIAGRRIGPLRALIDPVLDRGDLGVGDRAVFRHLLAELRADQAQVKLARFGAAAPEDHLGAPHETDLRRSSRSPLLWRSGPWHS